MSMRVRLTIAAMLATVLIGGYFMTAATAQDQQPLDDGPVTEAVPADYKPHAEIRPEHRGAVTSGASDGLLDGMLRLGGVLRRAEPMLQGTSAVVQACSASVCLSPDSQCVHVAYPETEWRICMRDIGMKGLWVGPVDLKRGPNKGWMRVLYEAGLAEVMVAYAQGAGGKNYDLYDLRWGAMDSVTTEDAGPSGEVVTLPGDSQPKVVVELRDRGPAWLCKNANMPSKDIVRRGEEVLVWGVYDGGNYDNIIQYGFRDDGGMTFRTGVTGFNNNSANGPATKTHEPHMHTSLWRVDMDLNGPAADSAYISLYTEPATPIFNALPTENWFSGGLEGMISWEADRFTQLVIEDAVTNFHGNHLGYGLLPWRTGISRHHAAKQQWSQGDFAVTNYSYPHGPNGWTQAWTEPDNYLLSDIDGESVLNRDLVFWHNTAALHVPHDEDRSANYVPNELNGVTLTHWAGFDLEPHNLFDHNPLGGPDRCD